MVPNVKNVEAEFHPHPLLNRRRFRKAHIPIVDARSAANRPRRITDRTRRHGGVCELVGVEGKTAALPYVLLDEVTWREPGIGVVVRLPGSFEVEGRVQLLDIVL